ncbi:hypothetical protein TRFO_29128 [Tritrichomonas foetus]|uniref:Uncharacterized protein n=1 Tax=Tritrichomonas foetus TaxID=1144522 RepID=A0A1J4K196_9EUKA|nr:hypothetical protein TRFO_29128 [Tritrichomonas foetus]|eukprot:OHT03516.1 hypothetical protein TRFO_29128 [Tritrichomonas foetus]
MKLIQLKLNQLKFIQLKLNQVKFNQLKLNQLKFIQLKPNSHQKISHHFHLWVFHHSIFQRHQESEAQDHAELLIHHLVNNHFPLNIMNQ